MNKKSQLLEKTPIGKLLIKMSVPASIGMIVMTLYNVVDAIFIGHYIGSIGLAAVSIVFPIMLIIISVSIGFGVGAASLISINYGKKNINKANEIFNNFIFLITLLSIFFSIIFYFFIDKILIILGSSKDILPFAKDYFFILIFGVFFQMFSGSINNIIRAEGAAKTAMVTMIIGAILNIFLDWLFLVIFNFGIKGIAISTVIAQFFQFLFILSYFIFDQSILKINFNKMLPKINLIKETIKLGFPSFLRQFSMSIIVIIMNNLLNKFGTELDIAAYGIIFRLMMIIIMPAMGILQGSQPIIGYNFGAKKIQRVKDVLKLSIKSSTIIISIFFLGIMIFPEYFIKIFTNSSDLINITKNYARIMFLFIPFIGFQFIGSGFFQSIGKAKPALITSLLRQFLIILPLILILPYFFGIYGIWWAYPITDLTSVIITWFLFKKEYTNLDLIK